MRQKLGINKCYTSNNTVQHNTEAEYLAAVQPKMPQNSTTLMKQLRLQRHLCISKTPLQLLDINNLHYVQNRTVPVTALSTYVVVVG